MKWRLAGPAVLAAAAAGAVVVAGGGEEPVAASEPGPARATASVERTDLVDRENISGTLGYAGAGTLVCAATGTLTALRDPGTVVTRGHSLYDVDDEPGAFLFYGTLPAWRDFAPGMTDGDDVRQLERNLRALGYDTGDVDRDWDSDTTEAVEQFQRDRDLDDDGTLARGEVVFRPGSTRVGEAKAQVGQQLAPGAQIAELSDDEKEEFKQAALANARCMREHGIDFPDPEFDPNGGARVKINKSLNPEGAKFQAAQKACEKTMPMGPSTSTAGEDEK